MAAGAEGRAIVVSGLQHQPLSAVEIAVLARATAEQRQPAGPAAEGVVQKLSALGFAFPGSWPPGPEVAAPPPTPDSRTPLLRRDLVLERLQPSLFGITDLITGQSAKLYDFEMSVARMLTGGRTYAQVAEGARQLGVPAVVESVAILVTELERLGFMVGPGAARDPGPDMSRPAREPWDEETRALYQSALRLMRRGRYSQARARLGTLLERSPEMTEAREAMERVAEDRSADEQVEALTPPPARASRQAGATTLPVRLYAAVAAAVLLLGATAIWISSRRAAARRALAAQQLAMTQATQQAPQIDVSAPSVAVDGQESHATPVSYVEPPPISGELYPAQHRMRPVLERVVAPLSGKVAFQRADPKQVHAGDVVAIVRPRPVLAGAAGWFLPAVESDSEVSQGQLLAVIRDLRGSAVAPVSRARPKPSWGCELLGGADQKATCRISSIKRRGRIYWVSFTFEALWFDSLHGPRVRLGPRS